MDDGNLHILYCDILACSLRILSFGGHQPTTNVSMMITHSTLSPRNGTKAQWQIVKIINNKSALHTINAFACFAFDLLWCRDTLSPYIYIYGQNTPFGLDMHTYTRALIAVRTAAITCIWVNSTAAAHKNPDDHTRSGFPSPMRARKENYGLATARRMAVCSLRQVFISHSTAQLIWISTITLAIGSGSLFNSCRSIAIVFVQQHQQQQRAQNCVCANGQWRSSECSAPKISASIVFGRPFFTFSII